MVPKQQTPDALLNTCLLCFVVAFGGLALIVLVANQWDRLAKGYADFLALYTGGALLGTKGLYSEAANSSFQMSSAGFRLDGVRFTRLPLYAALFWPLSKLPYLPAYWIFQSVNVAALALYARMHRLTWVTALSVATFLPVALSFFIGQDICVVLLALGWGVMLLDQKRDLPAGLALSVCAIKFHLFLFVPVALIIGRKWRVLLGGLIGCSLWIALSTILCGPGWFTEYYAILRDPTVTPDYETMSNIFGQFSRIPAVILTVLLLAALLIAARQMSPSDSVATAVAAGLLVNGHSYINDCVLMLPLLLAAIRFRPIVVRVLAVFLLSPIPYMLLLLQRGEYLVLSVIALVVSLVAFGAGVPYRRPEPLAASR